MFPPFKVSFMVRDIGYNIQQSDGNLRPQPVQDRNFSPIFNTKQPAQLHNRQLEIPYVISRRGFACLTANKDQSNDGGGDFFRRQFTFSPVVLDGGCCKSHTPHTIISSARLQPLHPAVMTLHPISPRLNPYDPHSTVLQNNLASQRLTPPLSATIHLPSRRGSEREEKKETRKRGKKGRTKE